MVKFEQIHIRYMKPNRNLDVNETWRVMVQEPFHIITRNAKAIAGEKRREA